MEHKLKTLPEYFEAITSGRKTFEVRLDDRPFAEGDTLLLEEYGAFGYTGRTMQVTVTYVLRYSVYCKDGYCIMGIKPVASTNADRIRGMSDEELARFLDATQAEECKDLHELAPDGTWKHKSLVNGWLNWLRQPAEEGHDGQ